MSLNSAKASQKQEKYICCAKYEGAVDYSTVTTWFKSFGLGWKKFGDQVKSSRPKTVDSEAVPKAIEPNVVYCIQRVSSVPSIQCRLSPSRPWQKHLKLSNCVLYPKILQNFCKTFDSHE